MSEWVLTDLSDFDHLAGLFFYLVGNIAEAYHLIWLRRKELEVRRHRLVQRNHGWPSIIFYLVDLVKGPRLIFRIRVRPQLPLFWATGDTYWALFLPGFLKSLRDSLKASIALHTQEAKKEQLTSKRPPRETVHIHTFFSLFPLSLVEQADSSHEFSMSSTRPVEPGGRGNLFHLALDGDSIENDLAIFFSNLNGGKFLNRAHWSICQKRNFA